MLTVAGEVLWRRPTAVSCLATEVAIQFEACLVCQKLGHVEVRQKLLATSICRWVVGHSEKAGRVQSKWSPSEVSWRW